MPNKDDWSRLPVIARERERKKTQRRRVEADDETVEKLGVIT